MLLKLIYLLTFLNFSFCDELIENSSSNEEDDLNTATEVELESTTKPTMDFKSILQVDVDGNVILLRILRVLMPKMYILQTLVLNAPINNCPSGQKADNSGSSCKKNIG
jgi:hypothetical protein